jgi:hypothetical protein
MPAPCSCPCPIPLSRCPGVAWAPKLPPTPSPLSHAPNQRPLAWPAPSSTAPRPATAKGWRPRDWVAPKTSPTVSARPPSLSYGAGRVGPRARHCAPRPRPAALGAPALPRVTGPHTPTAGCGGSGLCVADVAQCACTDSTRRVGVWEGPSLAGAVTYDAARNVDGLFGLAAVCVRGQQCRPAR